MVQYIYSNNSNLNNNISITNCGQKIHLIITCICITGGIVEKYDSVKIL